MADPKRWFSQARPVETTEADGFVDAHEVFAAVHAAIKTATKPSHYILLAGWHVDLEFGLIPQGSENDHLTSLRTLLTATTAPTKRCLYDLDLLPKSKRTADNWKAVLFFWGLPNGAGFLDMQWLPAGSNHQKIVIVGGNDGLIAFCGGVDLHPHRFAWKDVSVRLRGGAAKQLLETFNQRWLSNVDAYLKPTNNPYAQRLLKELPADWSERSLRTVPSADASVVKEPSKLVQVGRTYGSRPQLPAGQLATKLLEGLRMPRNFAANGEFTVFDMLVTAIRNARESIYVEDQYVIGSPMRQGSLERELNHALAAKPKLQLVLVMARTDQINAEIHQGWARRKDTLNAINLGLPPRANLPRAWALTYTNTHGPPYIHSKTWIFDDDYAIVGSANYNRRGLSYDPEVVAGITGSDKEGKPFAETLRARLWHRHYERDPANKGKLKIENFRAWNALPLLVQSGSLEFYQPDAGKDQPIEKVTVGPANIAVTANDLWNWVLDPDGSV